jgi:hypothetical protein
MDTVTIDGVEYIKASVLARKHRYTSDYIGQLCRGKKVDAHLVGRTWYVYAPSLEGHKSTRYADLRSADKTTDITNKTTSSRIDVEAPISKKLIRNQKPHFHDRVVWKPSTYETEDTALLPVPAVRLDQQPRSVPIKLAESSRVRVASVSKYVSMVSKPLPAIALSGTLKVQDFTPKLVPEDSSEYENYVNNTSDSGCETHEAIDPGEVLSVPSKQTNPSPSAAFLRRLDNQSDTSQVTGKSDILPPVSTFDQKLVPVSAEGKQLLDQRRSLAVPKRTLTPSQDPRTSLFFKLVIAPAVILLLAGVTAALLAVETVTVVGGGEQVASLRFNPSLFLHFFTAW